MPYSYPGNVPDTVKNLPEGAQRIFVEVFNGADAAGKNEDEARMAAWGAVKNAYEQTAEGEWKRKASESLVRYVGPVSLAEGNRSDVQVFRTGTFYHPLYGKFTITDDTMKAMVENFRTVRPVAPTEMVVDYEHMSDLGTVQAPAAGWVKDLAFRPGVKSALYATVDWTDEAAGFIRDRKYRYISPVWNMNYKHKETGKEVGPTLVAMALTNRPYIEGMEPVVLSERIERANAAVMALSEATVASYAMLMAEWDNEYINDLPDDCFAYVAPGGEKDEQGKTVPRALRHLPFKSPQGNISIDHLRNALARLDQTSLPPEAKAKARAILEKAAEEAGVGETGNNTKEGEDTTMEEKLRELLGLGPDDDIVEAVTALKAKVDEAEAAKTEAQTEAAAAREKSKTDLKAKDTAEADLRANEVTSDVAQAVRDGKLLPAQVDWAKNLRAKDPAAFKTFLETARAGPDLDIRGKDARPGDDDIQLTDSEKKSAKMLGVDPAETLAQKRKDAVVATV